MSHTGLGKERPAASMRLLGTEGGFLSHYRFQTRGRRIHSHFLQVIFDEDSCISQRTVLSGNAQMLCI